MGHQFIILKKIYTFFYYVSDISSKPTTDFNWYRKNEITFCFHYDLKSEINKTEMAEIYTLMEAAQLTAA